MNTKMMFHTNLKRLLVIGFGLFLVVSCRSEPSEQPNLPVNPFTGRESTVQLKDDETAYRQNLAYTPEAAQYFELVDNAVEFSSAELSMLGENGFVVSDRLAWNRFIDAYAWIYWQDLPVLITTDSLLHALHQSYNDLMADLEVHILMPQLDHLLSGAEEEVRQQRTLADPQHDEVYADTVLYLTVAQALLRGDEAEAFAPEASRYIALAQWADRVEGVDLFGQGREIDFTLFKPRGRYEPPYPDAEYPLANYFRAMSWLAHIDLRFVSFDPETSSPELNRQAIAAAMILRDALEQSGERATWQEMETMLQTIAGESDNTRLPDLDRLLADAGVDNLDAVMQMEEAAWLDLLLNNDYGQQRITGQIIGRHVANDSADPVPRPVSFMLFGQRFSIDSYVLGNLVFDRLIVGGETVERALPNPLDMAYALGNNRAVTHLDEQLDTFGYDSRLAGLRDVVDNLDPSYWDAPVYNQWLNLIRRLNLPTIAPAYTPAMQTEAWADKTLHTQLASWAQLRHDHILYTKQSFTTSQIVCEYPAGYVEPYPEFFLALRDFARSGIALLEGTNLSGLDSQATEMRTRGLHYFTNLQFVADQLALLADKELRQEPFSEIEEAFIQNLVIRQIIDLGPGCGGPRFEEDWDGWYRDLFDKMDGDPAVIADVHTNPNQDPLSALYPPTVLHVATGRVSPLYFILDTGESQTLYVGPAFTYYEIVEKGNALTAPLRLTDQLWRERLEARSYPTAPEWTRSFRLPPQNTPDYLELPMESTH